MKQKCLAEFLGTFALVFAGTGAIVINDLSHGAITHVGIALTFGLIVTAMIYATGDVSGAHLNPAVTLGFFLARRLPARQLAPYIAGQLAGAFAASGNLLFLFGNQKSLGATLPSGSPWQSFVLEVILTAILMFVILRVAIRAATVRERSPMVDSPVIPALAIGATVGLEALFAGPISGASMNPARSLAPALLSGNLNGLWLYLTAPFLGAALAVPLWRMLHPMPTTVPASS